MTFIRYDQPSLYIKKDAIEMLIDETRTFLQNSDKGPHRHRTKSGGTGIKPGHEISASHEIRQPTFKVTPKSVPVSRSPAPLLSFSRPEEMLPGSCRGRRKTVTQK